MPIKMVICEKTACTEIIHGVFKLLSVQINMGCGTYLNAMRDFLTELGVDPDNFRWHDLASCQRFSFNLFFEDYESNKTIANQIDDLCSHCPVQKECFNTGIAGKETGVWGGFYLINGEVDKSKNSHKSQDKAKSMLRRIFIDESLQ